MNRHFTRGDIGQETTARPPGGRKTPSSLANCWRGAPLEAAAICSIDAADLALTSPG